MIPEVLSADLVLRNGKIVTVDPDDTAAQTVVVKGNSTVVVGGDEDVSGLIGEETEVGEGTTFIFEIPIETSDTP